MSKYPHVYRHLALIDLFREWREVIVREHLIPELDALEELGWVEERLMGVYVLTRAGEEAVSMEDIGMLADGKSLPPGFST